jgi:hypothetical protein
LRQIRWWVGSLESFEWIDSSWVCGVWSWVRWLELWMGLADVLLTVLGSSPPLSQNVSGSNQDRGVERHVALHRDAAFPRPINPVTFALVTVSHPSSLFRFGVELATILLKDKDPYPPLREVCQVGLRLVDKLIWRAAVKCAR